ncbi:MAG: SpoIIE family protein phosphatase [Rhodothermales bacterium]
MTEQPTREQRSERFDLRTIYETSGLLSASLDLDFIANNLLLTAMSKLLAMRGAVWMTSDPSSREFVLQTQKGCRDIPQNIVLQADLPHNQILADDDIPADFCAGYLQVLAPISFGTKLLGVIGLGGSARDSGFSKQEIEFVSSLVNISSAAFQNSITFDKLRSANRELDSKIQQLNTLFDLSQEFNATVDRVRLVKLLTLSLMGQLLVSKHVFLLKRPTTAAAGSENGSIEVISARGIGDDVLPDDMRSCLFSLEAPVRVDDPFPEDADPKCVAAAGWLRREGLEVVMPIKHQDVTTAVLCLGPKMTGQPYSEGDTEFVAALGNLASVSIANSMLVEEQLEKERLEQEMKLARQIQEKLQPSVSPEVRGLDVAYVALPSRLVAGDYLDIIPLPGERALFAIGDVTGKGMPASLLMSNVQACLHVLLPMDMTLEEATGHINRVICGNTAFDKFITFFHAIFESETHKLKFVNAGHNPPIVVRANGSIELLETGGLLLGVMANVPYQLGTLELQTGDVVALFTDGVTEAMNADDEEYGEERLTEVLVSSRAKAPQAILDATLADIRDFTGPVDALSDDLTMIVIKVVD